MKIGKVKKAAEKIESVAEKAGVNLDIPDEINIKVPEEIEIEVPKKVGFKAFLFFLVAVASCVFAGAMYMYVNIPKASASIGNTLGTLTGTAVGSLQAVQEMSEAIDDGAEEGRSAEDTVVTIDKFLRECGQLQVMRSKVKFVNLNNNANNYVSLNKKTGNAVFTVNLLDATYDAEKKELKIPDVEVRLDLQDTTERLAEYSSMFGGNAMDGVIGTINTEVKTTEEAVESLKNDDALINQVREKSLAQIEQLLEALTGEKIKVCGSW